MHFTLVGRPIHAPAEEAAITCEDGVLQGDPDLIAFAQEAAARAEEYGILVGPVCGPYTERDHLASPISAAVILNDLFFDPPEASGELPQRAPIPECAVS